jgi:hypothetical protein
MHMQKRILISYLLIALVVEKIVQHTFVSLAFLYDIGGVRSTVAVDYRALMISGAVLAILFAVALPALTQRKRWSLYLVAVLAASDIIGEFIAQGTVFVTINISLIVATILLILCIFGLRTKLYRNSTRNIGKLALTTTTRSFAMKACEPLTGF